MQPPYSPDTVNQTVEYGGKTWKGNPGSSWSEQVKSPSDLANEQRGIFMEAIKPAVNSLEASRPEVNTAYDTRASQVEASKTPLQERYQKLIDDIKGNAAGQVTETQRTTAQEFARRGISNNSEAAAQELQARVNPIQQWSGSEQANIGMDREEKLRGLDDLITNLTQEKVAAQRDITNTIAQIQSSAGTDAAKAAIQMYQFQESQRQAALDRAIAEKNAETARITATQEKSDTASVQGGLYDVKNNRWIVPPKPDSGSGNNLADILGLNKTGMTTSGVQRSAWINNGSGGSEWEQY